MEQNTLKPESQEKEKLDLWGTNPPVLKEDHELVKPGGRPLAPIDWEQFRRVATLPLSQEDVCWLMGITVDTACKRVKLRYGITFSEYREKMQGAYRKNILLRQYTVAMRGNTAMLIWLGKQIGQTDKMETKAENSHRVNIGTVKDLEGKSDAELLETYRKALK